MGTYGGVWDAEGNENMSIWQKVIAVKITWTYENILDQKIKIDK